MNLKEKMKNYKIDKKLKIYRISMIGLIILMGLVSGILAYIMHARVEEITEVWSPSLSCVQELNTLTSDYRLKQYGHLVATDAASMASYEEELENVDKEISTVSASFDKLISTDYERGLYQDIQEKWTSYKEQSEEILLLSTQGKTEEAGLLMIGDVYDTFKAFNESFSKLETYENNELTTAKNAVQLVFIIIVIITVIMVVCAALLATYIGNMIGRMISEPAAQIEEAIVHMREGDFSRTDLLVYESEDELGVIEKKLKETLETLTAYVTEISGELRKIAQGDLTRHGEEITDFLGEFSSIKESLLYILKRFNSTLAEIQTTSGHVATASGEIEKASAALSDAATEQAGAVEELTATVNTVSDLAVESAKAAQKAYDEVKVSTEKAEQEKKKMEELKEEMEQITEISKEIEKIIHAIEDIASQTNLLSLNASIEAARAGDAGRGFAVVADQIGKLATDSAQSAVTTRNLINKTMEEIAKGNTITISVSEAFEQIIAEMESFAEITQQTTENATAQAGALKQIEQGIEQISASVQNTAASSEENTAISVNLSEKADKLDELVTKFKLF